MFGLSTTVIAAIAVVFLVLVLVLLIVLNTRQKKAKALAQRVEKPWDANSEQAGGRRGSTPAPSGKQVPPPYAPPVLQEPAEIDSRFQEVESPESDPFAAFAPDPVANAVPAPAPATEAAESVIEWEAEPIIEDEAATAPAPEAATAPEEPYQQAPPVEPARPAGAQAPPAAGTPLADPVAYLIASLLEGQGDLTEAELRRLELYRPGRVITVAEGLKAQVTGKGKEARLSRLARVQQYAQTLQVQAEERTATQQAAAAARIIEESEQQTAQVPSGLSLDRELSLLPPEPMLTTAPLPAPPSVPATSSTPVSVGEPGPTGATTVATGAAAAGVAWVTSEASHGEIAPEEVIEEEPVPFIDEPAAAPLAVEEMATMPAGSEGFGWEEWRPAEETPIVEAPAPIVEPPAPLLAAPAPTTAEGVLSLPAGERAGALAGLTPAELSRALKQSSDGDFKRAVIDTLEADGSADALFVVNECLEDPDTEIQVYALDTAERLLRRR